MHIVLGTIEFEVTTVEETAFTYPLANKVVDARVLLPVGRTNPKERTVADALDDGVDVLLALRQIADKQLIAAQAKHDVVGLDAIEEVLQCVGSCPKLGRRTVPDDARQVVTILERIVTQALCQPFEHRVAEDHDAILAEVGLMHLDLLDGLLFWGSG